MQSLYKYRCNVTACRNVYYANPVQPNKRFFSLPKFDLQRKKWIEWLNNQTENKVDMKTTTKMYICEDHFTENDYTDTTKKRLLKFATPSVMANLSSTLTPSQSEDCSPPKRSCLRPTTEVRCNLDNVSMNKIQTSAVLSNKFSELSMEIEEIVQTSSLKANITLPVKEKSSKGILSRIGISNKRQLAPREEALYKIHRQQQSKICKMRTALKKSRSVTKKLQKLSYSQFIEDIERNFTPDGAHFLKSQFANWKRKKPMWSLQDKVFALALYKRGPRCYRFLKSFVHLPSKSTIDRLMRRLPCGTGLNTHLLDKLKTRVSKMNPVHSYCSLMFDEISLATTLTYSSSRDCIIGFEDLGPSQKSNKLANHALVFMVQGLCSGWKQPLSYFFTKDTIAAKTLKSIIEDTIKKLQEVGINIVCTVCDQGPTNVRALRLMKDDNGPYFYVNNKRIVFLYDIPHLLKSTRNAMSKYTIIFEKNKSAKFKYLIRAFNHDKARRFQMLRKIRECYLNINKYPMLKMKVGIAAKTLSNTMAASIETMIADPTLEDIPGEAMQTAEFVQNMNDLFDSLNSNGISKKYKKSHPPLRCGLTSKSRHISFWKKMYKFVESWRFLDESTGHIKDTMPFKQGWLNNLMGIKYIWSFLQSVGFKYLRTRLLNQDSLENLFSQIRQYGGGNSNPSCNQFESALNTSILNNLISTRSRNGNCENDDGHLLYNLRDYFSENNGELSNSSIDDNELNQVQFPNFNLHLDNLDFQALAYVSGYLVKNIENDVHCNICKTSLLANEVEPQHIFTSFKEYDDKKRLKYVTEDLCLFIAHTHDIINFCLKGNGFIQNINTKLEQVLCELVDFSWFVCSDHSADMRRFLLDGAITLIIRKYCDDIQRNFVVKNRVKNTNTKINKFKHRTK